MIAPVLLTRLMKSRGMTAAFLWEGAVIFVCAVLVWLLVRDAPEELPVPARERAAGEKAGLSRGQWGLLLLATLLVGSAGGPGFSHLTMLYTSSGYDRLFVAGLLSYLGAMISLGKILCGQVYDRLGGRGGNRFAFGTLLLSLLLCTLAPAGGAFLPVLAITAFGLGMSITAVSPARWARDLCADYESAVRTITLAFTAGMLVFGPLPGLLADWLGGYVPAYAVFFVLLLTAFLIIQRLYRKKA